MSEQWTARRTRVAEIRQDMRRLVDEAETIFAALEPVTYKRQRDSITEALLNTMAAMQAIEDLCTMVVEHPEMLGDGDLDPPD